MLKESLETGSVRHVDNNRATTTTTISPDMAEYNSVFAQQHTTYKSLVIGADDSLSFGTNDLHNPGAKSPASINAFDGLNTDKARKPANDVLSKSEITQGAYNILMASDSNGNSSIEQEEWMKVGV